MCAARLYLAEYFFFLILLSSTKDTRRKKLRMMFSSDVDSSSLDLENDKKLGTNCFGYGRNTSMSETSDLSKSIGFFYLVQKAEFLALVNLLEQILSNFSN
jgi:hypothetical protein